MHMHYFIFIFRALINSNTNEAGSLILQDPISDPDDYCLDDDQNFGDKIFKSTCCSDLFPEDNVYCAKYFDRRPRNDCEGYVPPSNCK